MEMNALNPPLCPDPSEFMKWNWNQIYFWIMGLEGGRFKRYETVLKESLSNADLCGEDLLDVTPLVIKLWGIKERKDRSALSEQMSN